MRDLRVCSVQNTNFAGHASDFALDTMMRENDNHHLQKLPVHQAQCSALVFSATNEIVTEKIRRTDHITVGAIEHLEPSNRGISPSTHLLFCV